MKGAETFLNHTGWHYLSNATCLIRPRLFVFRRVKDHHNLSSYSLCLKKSCVRQVVLDKWFPLRCWLKCCNAASEAESAERPGPLPTPPLRSGEVFTP